MLYIYICASQLPFMFYFHLSLAMSGLKPHAASRGSPCAPSGGAPSAPAARRGVAGLDPGR